MLLPPNSFFPFIIGLMIGFLGNFWVVTFIAFVSFVVYDPAFIQPENITSVLNFIHSLKVK